MKTLLIDNGSTLTDKLAKLSPGNETVVTYANIPENLSEFSLVILSGSSKFPVNGNENLFEQEIELIRTATVPIVGICFGHELIAHALGGEVVHLGQKYKGMNTITVTEKHTMFGDKNDFTVYENHQYGIVTTPPELKTLAVSENSIAVFQHTSSPVYGFQFHPEHLTEQQFGDEIFLSLFRDRTS
jgi:GMP synthase-like glutamine amidotransferase